VVALESLGFAELAKNFPTFIELEGIYWRAHMRPPSPILDKLTPVNIFTLISLRRILILFSANLTHLHIRAKTFYASRPSRLRVT
jgi:hypothetical protein